MCHHSHPSLVSCLRTVFESKHILALSPAVVLCTHPPYYSYRRMYVMVEYVIETVPECYVWSLSRLPDPTALKTLSISIPSAGPID